MTVVTEMHETYGAGFLDRGDRRVVGDYGRPERTHRAVRNGVGVIEMGYGVVVVEGNDRVEFVDDTVSNRVPGADGAGVYALLLDPQGRIETDLYVYNAGERLLCFTPPTRAGPLAEKWAGNVFIRDVEIRDASTDFGVFGVHGPNSTEKVASVLNGAGSPEPELTFVRGSMGGEGVTVIASDGPVGEEGYEIVCAADAADRVFETLLSFGMNAVPFGYRTWETLTLEAGTPLFDTELDGRIPNVLGLRNALDFASRAPARSGRGRSTPGSRCDRPRRWRPDRRGNPGCREPVARGDDRACAHRLRLRTRRRRRRRVGIGRWWRRRDRRRPHAAAVRRR